MRKDLDLAFESSTDAAEPSPGAGQGAGEPRDVEGHAAASATASAGEQAVVIEARPGWRVIDLRECWGYRHLLWILALRDLRVRYKQTVLGGAWALLQPLVMMVVFSTLFTLVGRYPSVDDGLPYAVTLYCALLPWQMFAYSLRGASESLVQHQRLITKVYFPRVLVPLAPSLTALVDFALAFVILIGMMLWFGIAPSATMLTLPAFLALGLIAAWGAGLWLSALNALYRDIQHTVPFLIQVMMFLSPVVYETAELIPERWQLLYGLNPLVTVLEGFRWAILGKTMPAWEAMVLSTLVVFALLITGMFYFRRVERTLADRV